MCSKRTCQQSSGFHGVLGEQTDPSVGARGRQIVCASSAEHEPSSEDTILCVFVRLHVYVISESRGLPSAPAAAGSLIFQTSDKLVRLQRDKVTLRYTG